MPISGIVASLTPCMSADQIAVAVNLTGDTIGCSEVLVVVFVQDAWVEVQQITSSLEHLP